METSTPAPLASLTTHCRMLVTSGLSVDRPSEHRLSVSVAPWWWRFTAVNYNNNHRATTTTTTTATTTTTTTHCRMLVTSGLSVDRPSEHRLSVLVAPWWRFTAVNYNNNHRATTTHCRMLVTSGLSVDRPSEHRLSVSVAPWWRFTAVNYNNNHRATTTNTTATTTTTTTHCRMLVTSGLSVDRPSERKLQLCQHLKLHSAPRLLLHSVFV